MAQNQKRFQNIEAQQEIGILIKKLCIGLSKEMPVMPRTEMNATLLSYFHAIVNTWGMRV